MSQTLCYACGETYIERKLWTYLATALIVRRLITKQQTFGLRRHWGRHCLHLGTHWMPSGVPALPSGKHQISVQWTEGPNIEFSFCLLCGFCTPAARFKDRAKKAHVYITWTSSGSKAHSVRTLHPYIDVYKLICIICARSITNRQYTLTPTRELPVTQMKRSTSTI